MDPHAPNSNSLIVTNESKWLGWAPLEGAWIFGLYMHISYEESSELDSDDAKKRKKKKIYSLSRSQSVSQPVDFRRVPAGPIFSSGSVRFVFRVDQKNASRQGDRFVRLSFSWGISIVTVYSYQDTPILYASFTRNQYTYVALPSVIRQNSKSPPVSPSPYFYLKMLLLSPQSTYGDRQH